MKHNNLISSVTLSAVFSAALLFSASAVIAASNGTVIGKTPYKHFTMGTKVTADNYLAKTVNFKINPKYRQYCSEEGISISKLNDFFQMLGVVSIEKMYPHHQAPETKYNRYGQEMVDISLNYSIKYTANVSVEDAINYFYEQGNYIEFAEPHYVFEIFGTPNDPLFNQQTFMTRIQATTGWNTTTGSQNMVIAIVDSGLDFNHEDMQGTGKLWVNSGEAPPLDNNGIDDDNDGFIDDYRGWDFGMHDNNPDYSTNKVAATAQHGTHCAGLAAGATNNGKGIAGVGYDCKLMIVKISDDNTGKLPGSFAGLVYAADRGAKVISCSWGSVVPATPGYQQIIDYAIINKDAVVLAAAGNDGINEDAVPACLDRIVSVAATNSANDQRAQFSNYSTTVDVCAPGQGILSTLPGNNSYGSLDGTSMACPIAAGVAAMIRVMNPTFNALQVAEQLKATCDDIYASNPNPTYKGKLGSGRVNLAKAVGAVTSPSVLMSSYTSTDNNDLVYLIGDTIRYTCTFTNYLAPTTSTTTAVLSLVTATPDVTILSNTATLPSAIPMMGTKTNAATPFTVKINPSALPNTPIVFKLTTTTGTKVNIQTFTEIVNVDYLNIGVNDVNVSVPSNSRIGWVGENETGGGFGFLYNNVNLLFEGGLMVGVSSSQVSDLDRGIYKQRTYNDTDFVKQVAITRTVPVSQPANATWESSGQFDDSGTLNKIGITVDHKEYAWNSAADKRYVIFEYKIKNNSGNTLNNLYAGIFTDWDIDKTTSNKNFAATDAANRMGYTWRDTISKIYAGVKLLSHNGGFNNYCLDNDSTSGGIGSNGGYSSAKKYTMLSTNRANAGNTKGNDVLDVVSTGPFSINTGNSITVAFAMLAGDNLADIQATAVAAQSKYDGFTGITENHADLNNTLMQVYPNPSSSSATIEVNLQKNSSLELKVLDVLGHEVSILANGNYGVGQHRFIMDVSTMPKGIYYYRLRTDDGTITRKMMISK